MEIGMAGSRGWSSNLVRVAKWRKQSWAEKQGINIVQLGATEQGVVIDDVHRVTNWGRRKQDVQELLHVRDVLLKKGVRAVLVGTWKGRNEQYAVFSERQ